MERINRPEYSTDAELLRGTGIALYGEHFQAALCRDLGLRSGFVSEVLAGKKPLPARHKPLLARFCQNWLNRVAENERRMEAFEKQWRERSKE